VAWLARMTPVRGRFAPSPTGALHLGNLRTALLAWLMARHDGGGFVVRMEDLDRVTSSSVHEADQRASLRALGLDWDGDVVRQSDRFDLYFDAIARLRHDGLVYECYCTRREIREAAQAPQGEMPERYPGTCRELSARARAVKRDEGRRAALRLLSDGRDVQFHDLFAGSCHGQVDDIVLQRNDGVPAYNVAVVVDDASQRITEVVRGDDLLAVTPSQIELHRLLGLSVPRYAHVPLVLAPDGSRLAKRHGAVTLADLADRGVSAGEVCARLARSLGVRVDGSSTTSTELVDRFDIDNVPRDPWKLTPADL
jgi:glutamyl-tRNA synthetase